MEIRKPVLKKIPGRDLLLWNHFFRLNGDLSLEVGGKSLELFFEAPEAVLPLEYRVRMTCGDRTACAAMGIREGFLEGEMAGTFEGLKVKGLPAPLKAAIWEVLLEDLMEGFQSWTGVEMRMEEDLRCGRVPGESLALPFMLTDASGRREVQGWLYLDEDTFGWLSRLVSKLPASASPSCMKIALRCSLQAGRTRVTVAELKSAERLDLIQLDEFTMAQGKGLLLHIHPGMDIWAQVEGDKVILGERREREVSDSGNAQDVDAVEVELRFEVGEKWLTLGDLSSLKPGFTFDLETPLGRAVTIRANGKKIGYGELVEIDGHVGVQVLEVFGNATDRHV